MVDVNVYEARSNMRNEFIRRFEVEIQKCHMEDLLIATLFDPRYALLQYINTSSQHQQQEHQQPTAVAATAPPPTAATTPAGHITKAWHTACVLTSATQMRIHC